jgi:TctA family transporter
LIFILDFLGIGSPPLYYLPRPCRAFVLAAAVSLAGTLTAFLVVTCFAPTLALLALAFALAFFFLSSFFATINLLI